MVVYTKSGIPERGLTHRLEESYHRPVHNCVRAGYVRRRSYSNHPMPKTTKRAENRRAERIRRAHATELPEQEKRSKEEPRRPSGPTRPTRGLARYPWAITLLLLLTVGVGVYMAYNMRVGPFAIPPTPTPQPVSESPCVQEDILTQITNTAPAPTAEENSAITRTYEGAPEMKIDQEKKYCAGINTTEGLVVIELDPTLAPNTVNNFVFLAQNKYYDGLTFHRVEPGIVIQGGDPNGDGTGGPGYKFDDEEIKGDYTEGTVAMANSGANTNGSQFFVNMKDNSDGTFQKLYNLFGHVVQGIEILKTFQSPSTSGTTVVMNHVVVVEAP